MTMFGSQGVPRVLLAGAAVIVIAAALCAWWLLSSRDVVLFDGLEATQLDAASTELARAGIEYELDRDSGAIKVGAEEERRARLAIMSSGNAFRESVGFELFNGSDFGMTEFAQKINYQRAIEGELARTISALEEIKYARVHLVLPEHGLFRKQEREPRAAITVFLENGATLSPEQVRGVQRIAAAAVPEMPEAAVSVTDESGRILSTSANDDAAEVDITGRLSQKQAVERYLADKVRGVLTRALGAERFAVSVDAVLDFTRKTTKTERVLDGDDAGIKRIKESSRNEYGDPESGDRLKEVEYSLGHEVEQIDHGAGAIQRIHVGVIIDRDLENVDAAQLQELIAAAVGLDPARGDKVAVVRHGVAVQRMLDQVEQANGQVARGAERPALEPANASGAPKSISWALALIASLAIALAGAIVVLGMRRIATRREEARVEQLRHRLQAWIEAEQVEVGQ